ncbi:MAG: succinoglycan biosynthesis transport protein ExoP [Lentisphaeria bacterium]|jgi:succinoglycan biosynthesis transport protein ExoP
MEETGPSVEDYIDILRRRKLLFIFTVPVLLFISVAVAISLPPIYRSEGKILIQGQEIPEDLIKSTVDSFAEQQIGVTRQRIMTSANIMEIMDKFNLYAKDRSRQSLTKLAARFKSSIGVDMVEVDVPGQGGRVTRANIAFIVSFMDKSPVLAQRVANELTTLFLEDNVKTRTGKADETAQFLTEEADRMQARVQETERQIAEFKVEYGNSLPELLEFNLSTIERLEQQILDSEDGAVALGDQIYSLNIELTNISPFVQYSSDSSGQSITPRQRLMELKEEYSRSIIRYADSHPDIIRLKAEIKAAEQQVEEIRGIVSEEDAANPVYRQMKSQINSLENERARLLERRAKMEADLVDYKQRVVRTHQVQRNYDDLTRDYTSKLDKYQELRAKQLEANVAQNMEAENKAGSFILIEPPTVPEKPDKPDRKKLLMMGFILSFGAGIGLMLAAEFLDNGIRGVANISRVIGQPPLVVINHIYTPDDLMDRTSNRKKLALIMAGASLVGIVVFHFFVMGLDTLFLSIMAKINLL